MQLASQGGEFNPNHVQIMLGEISRIESIVSEYLSLAKPHQNSPQSLQNIENLVRNVITLFES